MISNLAFNLILAMADLDKSGERGCHNTCFQKMTGDFFPFITPCAKYDYIDKLFIFAYSPTIFIKKFRPVGECIPPSPSPWMGHCILVTEFTEATAAAE